MNKYVVPDDSASRAAIAEVEKYVTLYAKGKC
jgi:hypothetical protein